MQKYVFLLSSVLLNVLFIVKKLSISTFRSTFELKIAKMKYTTCIFDLDGTLLNTLDDLANSTNYALRLHSMQERTREEVRRFVGNGVKKLIERAVPAGTTEEETERVLADFRSHYLEHDKDTTRPYDGILEMLERIKNRGIRTAVVSNKFFKATESLCSHFFGSLIDVAIGENEAAGIRKKPSPDTVREAIRQLEVETSDCVYIGDSDVDVMTAKNSGMDCISVLWGFRDEDFLSEKGATKTVRTPSELTTLLLG